MPGLENGEFASEPSKFKKRRAWITSDEPVVTLPIIQAETEIPAASTLLVESKTTHEQKKSKRRVKRRLKKRKTKVKLGLNKSKTRAKQELNKSEIRVEHYYNKSQIIDTDSFYAFIISQRTTLNYDDDLRSILLSLSDVQRRLFWHVTFECINREDLRTAPLEIKGFFSPLGISTDVVRTSLVRLINKRLIQREKGKLGRNGFAIIALPKIVLEIAQELVMGFQNSKK